MRKIQFVNGEYYHVYNRSVEERQLFEIEGDYLRFLRGLKDFNNKSFYEERKKIIDSRGFKELSSFLTGQDKVVSVLSHSLIPNHYHFILKQIVDGGISKFMHKLGTSYTNFFNKKFGRSGSLFQGPFKAIHINTNEYLLWLFGYVNGNIEIHKIAEAETYKWSSYRYFLGLEKNEVLDDKNIILSQFSTLEELKNFVKMVIEESRKRKDLEKYLLEKLD